MNDPAEKLSYGELVKILCNVVDRQNKLESWMLQFFRAVESQSEFTTEQMLNLSMDMTNYKVPWRRFDQIEQDLTNYIAFNESDKKEARTFKKKRFNEYE